MKKEHCVLILICCFLMAACGRLEDIPEDLSAFPETERKETAETPAGPQFETLTVADDPITAEFSLTTRQEQAAFLYVTVEEDCTTTVNCTYASQDQPVTVCLAGGESWGTAGGIGGGIRRHLEQLAGDAAAGGKRVLHHRRREFLPDAAGAAGRRRRLLCRGLPGGDRTGAAEGNPDNRRQGLMDRLAGASRKRPPGANGSGRLSCQELILRRNQATATARRTPNSIPPQASMAKSSRKAVDSVS